MKRRRASITSCSRCGNEEDLRRWHDGKVYCDACLTCPHGAWPMRICAMCFLERHSSQTFQGPRIRNMVIYVLEALLEYGTHPWELLTHTHDEQQELLDYAATLPDIRIPDVTALPPHLRGDP